MCVCVCVCVCVYKINILAVNSRVYFPIFPHEHDVTLGQFFQRSLTGFISEYYFSLTGCYTKVKEPNYLHIT